MSKGLSSPEEPNRRLCYLCTRELFDSFFLPAVVIVTARIAYSYLDEVLEVEA